MTQEPMSVGERVVHDLLRASHLVPPDSLADIVTYHMRPLGVHRSTIYLADLQQMWLTPLPDGQARDQKPLVIDTTLAGLAYRTVSVRVSDTESEQLQAWVPLVDGTERLGVLEAVVDSLDEITLRRLRMLASLIALQVVSKESYSNTYARVRRRHRDMTIQAEMEWALMPPLTFATEQVVLSAALEPAYDLGGDAFDYSLIGDTLHVSVFDAMGHDLSAGLITSVGMASCRNTRCAGLDLADMVAITDQAIAAQFSEDRFLAGLFAHLHLPSGQLQWINCGYPPPLLIRGFKPITIFDHSPRPPLGLAVNKAPIHNEQLQPGDRVLFYSDGITEARSPEGALFGLDRLSDFVISNTAQGMPAPETLRRLTHAILDYQQGRLSDDATVVLVEWSPDDPYQLVP